MGASPARRRFFEMTRINGRFAGGGDVRRSREDLSDEELIGLVAGCPGRCDELALPRSAAAALEILERRLIARGVLAEEQ